MSVGINAVESFELLLDYEKYKPEATLCNSEYITCSQIAAAIPHLSTLSLQDRVKLLSISGDCKSSVYSIDNLLQVKTVSDEFRKKEIQVWKEEKSFCGKKALGFGVATVLSGAGSAVARFYLAAGPVVITALAVVSVATLVFTVMSYNKRSEASKQIAGWEKSPANELAEKRKTALENGFVHAYESNLKLIKSSSYAYLHPAEVTYLFEQYFHSFCNSLLKDRPANDTQTKRWIDKFKAHNPIASELLFYAYGEVPQKFIQVSKDFESMSVFLKNLTCEYERLRKERTKLADSEIKDIERERSALLMPLSIAMQHYKYTARQQRDAALAQLHIADNVRRVQVERDYDSACMRYQTYHDIATAPINALYNQRVKDAKQRLKTDVDRINQNEASATAPHYNYARGMLDYAFNLFRGTGNASFQSFKPEMLFASATPSAPSYETVFTPPQWNNVPAGVDPAYGDEFLNFVHYGR